MADFQFYLNRQGIRGLQGVKGDQGDSPIITVQTETPDEYILKITNPDGTELISPNLRGSKININEGTYVRYNTKTGELYTSTADGATGELAGVVRLATDADITNMDERAVVTPSQLADALSQYLVSPDGSVKIVQNAENSLTELTAAGGLTELPIASADTLGAVKIGENLSITEDGTLSANAGDYIKTSQVSTGGLSYGVYLNKYNGNKLDTIQPRFNAFDGALETHYINYLKAATYSASEPADEDMVNNWTNINGFLTGDATHTGFISGSVKFNAGSGSIQVIFKLMEAGYISGIDQRGRHKFSKIETSMDGTTYTEYNNSNTETKYIRFTFNYTFPYETLTSFSTRIRTLASNIAGGETAPLSVKVDNSTIQIVDDKLHANFDEINEEINNVSSRVTTLEGQVGDISTTLDSNTTDIENLKKTKNDNIFDIGKFTVVGNPTITEDGVASGFSGTSSLVDYITFSNDFASANTWEILFKFNTGTLSSSKIMDLLSSYITNKFRILINSFKLAFVYTLSDSVSSEKQTDSFLQSNTSYWVKILFNGSKYSVLISTDNINYIEKIVFNSTTKLMTNTKFGIGVNIGSTSVTNKRPFTGSIDLKHFSITVDGKETLNGLMNSTKPIYDKITTINTNLSNFELETSNNFSAVDSALNEKANLSDLSKCASLADFNRLSATVTALEGQVGDVSAVLDNINGEVI